MDPRILLIRDWLERDLGWSTTRIEPASADASFRRYFRVWNAAGATRIVMDAPPDKEDIAPYVRVAGLLAGCDVHVPQIDAADAARGLLLLEDLGSTHMLAALQAGADAGALYAAALDALGRIQLRGLAAARELPPYDRAALERELAQCPEWFCQRHLGLGPDAADAQLLAATFDFLVREALAQPVVFVHRDYHSRNLMQLEHGGPGILDFQDALAGPIGYDLVSLLKDCYIAWPRARVESWVEAYRQRVGALAAGAGPGDFLRWFDLIGLQRHIKVLGVFARLWYRDGKNGYLGDLPRVLDYVRDTAGRYPELAEFSAWVEGRLAPGLAAANARALAGVGR
jgi:aminoglycoside/choline kinase family phosphotransferase